VIQSDRLGRTDLAVLRGQGSRRWCVPVDGHLAAVEVETPGVAVGSKSRRCRRSSATYGAWPSTQTRPCAGQCGRETFAAAGFTVDGKSAERPTDPVWLWRGYVPQRRKDWSWTDNRAIVERYANGRIGFRPQGQVWQVLAQPAALLCRNNGRNEGEYVVDTKGLQVVEWSAGLIRTGSRPPRDAPRVGPWYCEEVIACRSTECHLG